MEDDTLGGSNPTRKFTPAKPRCTKTFCGPSFVCAATLMIAFNTLGESNSFSHVCKLRIYDLNPGRIESPVARFGDHIDSIFMDLTSYSALK